MSKELKGLAKLDAQIGKEMHQKYDNMSTEQKLKCVQELGSIALYGHIVPSEKTDYYLNKKKIKRGSHASIK